MNKLSFIIISLLFGVIFCIGVGNINMEPNYDLEINYIICLTNYGPNNYDFLTESSYIWISGLAIIWVILNIV